jgi:hypothetical protein
MLLRTRPKRNNSIKWTWDGATQSMCSQTADPTNPMDNAPVEVATMDNVPSNVPEFPDNVNAPKKKDAGKGNKNHGEGEDVKTEETANKPPDDGTTSKKPTDGAVTEMNDEGEDAKTDEPPDNANNAGDGNNIHEERGADKTIDDEEATENHAEWKDNKSEEPANESPKDDGNASENQDETGVNKTEEIADNTPEAGYANNKPEEEEVDETPDGGKATKKLAEWGADTSTDGGKNSENHYEVGITKTEEQVDNTPDDGGADNTTMEEIDEPAYDWVADKVQTEDDGALQLREEVHHASSAQKILTAEDTATAAPHDHPTHRDLVLEARVAGEVHQVPHYNKHVKGSAGITEETVGDMIIETTSPTQPTSQMTMARSTLTPTV